MDDNKTLCCNTSKETIKERFIEYAVVVWPVVVLVIMGLVICAFKG